MREYFIVEADLGFNLKKTYKEDGITTTVLYRNGKRRDRRKESAKTYYFKDEAISSLILARKYGGNEPLG